MKLPKNFAIGISVAFHLFSHTDAKPKPTCPYAEKEAPKTWTVETVQGLKQVMQSHKFDNPQANLLSGAEHSVQGRRIDDKLYPVQRRMYIMALSGTRISQITKYRGRWDWALNSNSEDEMHNHFRWRLSYFSKSLVQGSFKDVSLGMSNDITHRPIMKALLLHKPVWLEAAHYGELHGPVSPQMIRTDYDAYVKEMDMYRQKKKISLENSGLSELIKEHWKSSKKHEPGERSLIELWASNADIANLVNPESDMDLIVSSLMTVYHFTTRMADQVWPVIWKQLYQNHFTLPDALIQEVWDLGSEPSWSDINKAKHLQEAYVKLTSSARVSGFTVREAMQDVELERQRIRKGDLINLDIQAFQDSSMHEIVQLSLSDRGLADRMLSELMFGSRSPRTDHRSCPGRAVWRGIGKYLILGAVLATEGGYSAAFLLNWLRTLATQIHDSFGGIVPDEFLARLENLDTQLADKLVKRADVHWKLEALEVWKSLELVFTEKKSLMDTQHADMLGQDLKSLSVNLFTTAYEDM